MAQNQAQQPTLYETLLAVESVKDVEPPEGYTQAGWDRMRAAINCGQFLGPEPTGPVIEYRRPGCQLYRHYDADDTLLYVGISTSALVRLAGHKSAAHWFWRVATVKIEHFPDRVAAAQAETAAIRDERPLFNIEQNGKGTRPLSTFPRATAFLTGERG